MTTRFKSETCQSDRAAVDGRECRICCSAKSRVSVRIQGPDEANMETSRGMVLCWGLVLGWNRLRQLPSLLLRLLCTQDRLAVVSPLLCLSVLCQLRHRGPCVRGGIRRDPLRLCPARPGRWVLEEW